MLVGSQWAKELTSAILTAEACEFAAFDYAWPKLFFHLAFLPNGSELFA